MTATTGVGGRRPTLAAPVRAGARARPQSVRTHNRALVLQALYDGDGLSRADLARAVGLTPVTISDLVGDLLDEGLAIDLGPRNDNRPGKPATLLDINRGGLALAALDLSEDSVFRGALTDLDGNVVHREALDVAGITGRAAVGAVRSLVDRLVASAATRLVGIGVGSPGIVDASGTVLRAPNLAWHGVALQAELADHTGLPVLVVNDANAAALGERTFGGAAADMVLVRIGRGVGAGIVLGGTLVRGATSSAGEIGHVVVSTDDADTCACGRVGCLETWLAIPRLRAALVETDADDDATARDRLLARAGTQLGIALAPVVGALDLREVVLGGPQDLLDGPLIAQTASTIRDRTMADDDGQLTVRTTRLGRDIVALGAAVTVLTGQLGVS